MPLEMRGFVVRRRWAAWITLVVMFLLGAVMCGFSLVSLIAELRLEAANGRATAQVTDSRISQGKYQKNYDIRYRFQAPGREEAFTCADSTGRRDLWTGLSEDKWNEARAAGTVEVVYRLDDPWVNHPVDTSASPRGDALTGLVVLGLGPMLLALLAGFGAVRDLRKLADKPDDEVAGKYPFFIVARSV
jgi:hypothetical protein